MIEIPWQSRLNRLRMSPSTAARWLLAAAALALIGVGVGGCNSTEAAPQPAPVFTDSGYKPDLPDYMRGTVYERTDLANIQPYSVSAYSLVVNLDGTADNSEIPTVVRQAIIKRMALQGFGMRNGDEQYSHMQPEEVLRSKRVAIVQVEGRLPVGARAGQRFDVIVRAMPRSATSSLAHGHLYETELYNRGLEQPNTRATILAFAKSGDVFVNPQYALDAEPTPTAKASLRRGIVMGSGLCAEDRAIFLQLRVPQASIARTIEARIINRFQEESDRPAAAAQNEDLVALYVPLSFNGDWQHFVGIVNHLYLNNSPEFYAQKARQLVADAHKPGVHLDDISYCLEGLGPQVLPTYHELIDDPDPAISYFAARAAANVGDRGALTALVDIATDRNDVYQEAAIHALGGLTGSIAGSPEVDRALEPLLSSDQALVRIEAYKILADHEDRLILSEPVNQHFMLDIVDCGGPPLVYATQQGLPRLAIFGRNQMIVPPVTFMAMQQRLTIASNESGDGLTVFYRDPTQTDPVQINCGLSLGELVARLGGMGPEDQDKPDFTYGDIVAIMRNLSDSHTLGGVGDSGQLAMTSMVLEQPPELLAALSQAPSLSTTGRPQGRGTGVNPTTPSGATPSSASPPSMGPISPETTSPEPGSSVPSFSSSSSGSDSGAGSAGTSQVPSFGP